jgi:hypothetical protein
VAPWTHSLVNFDIGGLRLIAGEFLGIIARYWVDVNEKICKKPPIFIKFY